MNKLRKTLRSKNLDTFNANIILYANNIASEKHF